MFNPVIIIAIVIQVLISKASRIVGAIFGYFLTTGILIWGISVYGEGDGIALFGIPLSQPVFIIACLIWYGFDTKEFIAARKLANTSVSYDDKEKESIDPDRVICPKCGHSNSMHRVTCKNCHVNLSQAISDNQKEEVQNLEKKPPYPEQ